ncbi:hypothetical protein L1049_015171 [Liquidambar formosana]|uniref:Glycosyltransferase n=1 Tax=Liquidambar formosana TaxID=63359 RepID=A0AAP0RXM9_LIQFO
MDSKSPKLEIFFFPYVGGGHQIPMTDLARLFASHGVKSTILITPSNTLLFQKSIQRDQQSGHDINLHPLKLPPGEPDIADVTMSAAPLTDTSILRDPLHLLLQEIQPDCIVVDMFHLWAVDVVDGLGIPRIAFGGNGCFFSSAFDSIIRHTPHEKVDSDYDPFVVPGLPDRIEMTRSQLPPMVRNNSTGFGDMMAKLEQGSFGFVVNSFYELEPAYVDYFKKEMGKKAWLVGPVSVCNRNVEDKAERGQKASIDEHSCLSWLNSKEPNSVLYISFGSVARLAPQQLLEIAYGLKESDHPFIWVVGKILKSSGIDGGGGGEEENWLPDGFEKRMMESNKGLIIRGWAPQLLILEHPATGGFMTHCGWNSTTEGVSAGVPMITWPLGAEQFFNEKLITDVLRIGVKVGSVDWVSWNSKQEVSVGREKVKEVVERLMGGGDEAAEMRKRARELGEKAKRAVEEGGSSYADAEALIEELKSRRKIDS